MKKIILTLSFLMLLGGTTLFAQEQLKRDRSQAKLEQLKQDIQVRAEAYMDSNGAATADLIQRRAEYFVSIIEQQFPSFTIREKRRKVLVSATRKVFGRMLTAELVLSEFGDRIEELKADEDSYAANRILEVEKFYLAPDELPRYQQVTKFALESDDRFNLFLSEKSQWIQQTLSEVR